MSAEIDRTLAEVDIPANPFPGLRPFEFGESFLFFGRDGQSEQLLRKLLAKRFLAVVGTSGSGKSSLARAGLLPALLGQFGASGGAGWRVAVMRPGNDPLGALAAALSAPDVYGERKEGEKEEERKGGQEGEGDGGADAEFQTHITEAVLRRGSLGLVEAVRQARRPEGENLLVLVDQFEELFRFGRVAKGERYRNDAAAFVKLLLEATAQRETSVYVVITMRSDFLGDCAKFWDLPEAINEGQYLIPRLTREQRREAISGPVAVCEASITPRLVNRLLNDTGDDPGQLPILQHALMRTWDEWKRKRPEHADKHEGDALDICCYEEVGTLSDALSLHADEAFGELGDGGGQQVAEKVFKALTDRGTDSRETRRPMTLGQLRLVTGAPESEIARVVETFRGPGRSFLMPPPDKALAPDSLIDISHESLIRGWKRLRKWANDEAESAAVYRRLAESGGLNCKRGTGLLTDPELGNALKWRETSRPNKAWSRRYHPHFYIAMDFLERSRRARDEERAARDRKRRRDRNRLISLIVIFAALAAVSTGSLVYARAQQRFAEQKRQEADTARAEAERQKNIAEGERGKAIAARDESLAQSVVADIAKDAALLKEYEAKESARVAEEQAAIARRKTREAEAATTQAVEAKEATEKANLAQKQTTLDLLDEQGRQALALNRDDPRPALNYLARLYAERDTPAVRYLTALAGRPFAAASRTLDASPVKMTGRRAVYDATYSPDGRLIATASDSGASVLWDASGRAEPLWLDRLRYNSVEVAAFNKQGNLLVTAGNTGKAVIWEVGFAPDGKLTGELRVTLDGHGPGAVKAAAFSPDGRRVITGSEDKTARVWDAETGKELFKLEHEGKVNAVLFVPSDDKRVITAGDYKQVIIWFLPRQVPDGRLPHKGQVNSATLSRDGRYLLTASDDSTAGVWDMNNLSPLLRGPTIAHLGGHLGPVTYAAFSPDDKLVVTASLDGTARVWKRDGTPVSVLEGHDDGVRRAEFSPDGLRVVTASYDGTARVWDAATGKQLSLLWGHGDAVLKASFSPDGESVLTASKDNTARVWGDTRGLVLRRLPAEDETYAASFSPDGRHILTSGHDAKARVWDADGSRGWMERLERGGVLAEPGRQTTHTKSVSFAGYSRDGSRIVTTSVDGTTKLWDANTRALLKVFPPRPAGRQGGDGAGDGDQNRIIFYADLSRDNRLLVTAGFDGRPQIWDVESQKSLRHLPGHGGNVYTAVFNGDGTRVLTASRDGTARVWDVATGEPLFLMQHQGESGVRVQVMSALFSPDGRRVLTAGSDKLARVWDLPDAPPTKEEGVKELREPRFYLTGHSQVVRYAAFSPDGLFAVTAGEDRKAMVWDAQTGRLLFTLEGHEKALTFASFSPDGRRIITAAKDSSVLVWDAPREEKSPCRLAEDPRFFDKIAYEKLREACLPPVAAGGAGPKPHGRRRED